MSPDRQKWLWLVVEARRSAWVQATTDGQTDAGRVLQAGERRRILANHNISIVVGDAGAVTVSLNGGPATVAGRDGQVVTRRFSAADAEQIVASRARSGSYGAVSTVGPDAVRGTSGAPPANDARTEILTLSQRWLDGYYRRDNNAMAYAAVPDVSSSSIGYFPAWPVMMSVKMSGCSCRA